MIGRLLYHLAVCQLPNHVAVPQEALSRSGASSRAARVKTPNVGKDDTNAETIGAILDDAMRHMKLAGVFPGMQSSNEVL